MDGFFLIRSVSDLRVSSTAVLAHCGLLCFCPNMEEFGLLFGA